MKTRRVIVGRTDDFPDGRGTGLQIDGRRIAVFRLGGEVFAVVDRCPHRGFPLHDGRIKVSPAGDPQVQCRTHGATFDLKTGHIERGPARREVFVYAARIVGDEVEIEIPEA